MLESVKPLYLLGKTKKPVTITITGFTGDERIEKDINPLITQYF